ncbi:DUF4254 domain-containing protein [Actinomadura scrupuli]|uniref:DUF4254 domain-containing protein n=1 Tax=Actinomadura scrupuli TaxID=559629 RepID=UPI003D98E919
MHPTTSSTWPYLTTSSTADCAAASEAWRAPRRRARVRRVGRRPRTRSRTAVRPISSRLSAGSTTWESPGTAKSPTPGTIVDRLSVLDLRILHTHRAEQAPKDRAARLAVLEEQHADLLDGLDTFLTRIRLGQARFKRYRQFKSPGQRSYCPLFEELEETEGSLSPQSSPLASQGGSPTG